MSQNNRLHVKLKALLFICACLVLAVLIILSLRNRPIMIDEAWIGEQVKALLDHGTIVTNLFRDFPPLDQKIVITHKLLVWLGVGSAAVFGWGLYSLRLVSALAGLVTALVFFAYLRRTESQRIAIIGTVLLIWTPLFWEMMRIYRPEMLVTCLGFASFVVLQRARERGSQWLVLLAGVLSGLSGSAHPAGLAFAMAGLVALLFAREYRYLIPFALAAAIGFFPYVSGFVTDYGLASRQLFHNDTMSSMVRIEWWSLVVNLIEEHKRLFRQPMVIGISVMFILSLFLTKREEYRKQKFFWIYLITLFLCGAMAPFPKITRYMLPLVPFFVIVSARVLNGILSRQLQPAKWLRMVFILWVGVFVVYGSYALAGAALVDRLAPKEIAAHRQFAQQMVKGPLVMAPAKFIYPEADSFVIQSYWGARVAGGEKRSIGQLEEYAVAHKISYLLVDAEIMHDWHFKLPDQAGDFSRYHLICAVSELDYFLLERSQSGK